MRTVAEHQTAVTHLLKPALDRLAEAGEAEQLPLAAALGRTLATDVLAEIDVPPFDNSQMDGYAVRSADAGAPVPTVAPIPAGASAPPLPAGHAASIMTGAMLPAGADAVVPVEASSPNRFVAPGEPVSFDKIPAGQFIRKVGSDIAAGALALPAGTRLGPAQLGLLAALGTVHINVRRRLRVGIVSTGDELLAPGQPLRAGAIYDANSTLLSSALRDAGADPVLLPTVADDPHALAQLLAGLVDLDLVLSTGGVSQGAYEVVKQALSTPTSGASNSGHNVHFHTVAMQPGGPQALGTIALADGTALPFLGFPGNPVSTLISFEMFLRPLLAGARPGLRARLDSAVTSPSAKHQVRRGHFHEGAVELLGGPGSHLLHAMARANALVHFPVGVDEVAAGQEVAVWLL